jgi:hypothetical protein
MNAQTVCEKLRATPYKFTQASRFRDQIKQLPTEERIELQRAILDEVRKDCNLDIFMALREIVADLPHNEERY